MIKNKELSYLKYVNHLYRWAMSQKLPVNVFEQIKDISQLNEDFIKNVMKKMMKNISLNLIFNTLKYYTNFVMIYQNYQEE